MLARFWLILMILVSAPVLAEPAPAIGGYSPVSYFTEGKPEQGSAEFAVTHEGKTYHLTNAAQVSLFNQNPDKYRPRYETCPFSLTLGQQKPLDPTNFQILGGYLLLFHKSDMMDGLAAFKESGLTEEELIQRADKEYVLLRF